MFYDDFWIQERPFILILGEEYENELDDYIADGLPNMIGWMPKDIIGFAAMCNQKIDHRLPGEFCLYFAKSFDDLIDFGGKLNSNALHQVPGKIFTVFYNTEAGHEWCYHVGNPEFLEWRLKQPEFRMVK